jgi:hypothetical protein
MFTRRLSIGLFTAALAVMLVAPASAKDKPHVLVYSGSTGYPPRIHSRRSRVDQVAR